MTEPHSITADAFEILVTRELRRAGLEPLGLRRQGGVKALGETGFVLDLVGRLEAYGHRWPVLIECRNAREKVGASDIDALHRRGQDSRVGSILLFTTPALAPETLIRAHELRIAVLQVLDARKAFQADVMMGAQLPMWLPEFTTQVVWWAEPDELHVSLVEAGSPELILERLRP